MGVIQQAIHTNLSLALVHHPVRDKNGQVIASAVTNLDLHDISRAARTYGAGPLYVVTPLDDQRDLVRRIVAHWRTGSGAEFNPARRLAFELIRVTDCLEAVLEHLTQTWGQRPLKVATSARSHGKRADYGFLRQSLDSGRPHLLMFGTAWGLADAVLETADHVLPPIRGNTDYNHLSVRSAASIVLDRLLAPAWV